MGRWWLLFLFFVVWMGVGFVFIEGNSVAGSETVEAGKPARIVSLAPNVTEIVCALGLEKELVGVTLFSDYPAIVKEKANVGSFWQPNIETIIGLRPDLVVTLDFPQQRDARQRLERMGFRTVSVKTDYVAELFDAIEVIGKAAGCSEQARSLVEDMQARFDDIKARIGEGPRPRVLWVVQREPLRVAGRDTFVNELIELAGGENAIGPTVQKYPPIGAEQVIGGQVEVIIEPMMAMGGDFEEQQQVAEEYWGKYPGVPAVRNGRIYVISGDSVSRPGPRLCDGVAMVARCLEGK